MTLTNYNDPKVQCSLIVRQDMFHVAVSLTQVLQEKDLSLDLISSSQCKHCSLSSPFCIATSHNNKLKTPRANTVEFHLC